MVQRRLEFILICLWASLGMQFGPRLPKVSYAAEWTPERIESLTKEEPPGYRIATGSFVRFANGTQMNSDLIDMKYIGQLSANGKTPYVIFAARDNPWEGNVAVFMLSPWRGNLAVSARNQRFDYPGKLYAYRAGRTVVQESRMFLGDCLEGHRSVAIWFIKSRLATGGWKNSVYVAKVQVDRLQTEFLRPPLPSVKKTLAFVKSGQCTEVPGLEQDEEP